MQRIIGIEAACGNDQRLCQGLIDSAVLHHESGASVRGTPHLSKQGASRLRAVLYMAALTALRHNAELKAVYKRLRDKGKPALSALGAVMRKIVHIAFGVYKHQMPYNPELVSCRA